MYINIAGSQLHATFHYGTPLNICIPNTVWFMFYFEYQFFFCGPSPHTYDKRTLIFSCQDPTTTNFSRYKTSCSLFSSGQSFHSTLTAPLKSSTLILTVVSSFSNILCVWMPLRKKDWSVSLFRCVNLQVEVYPVHHLYYLGHIITVVTWWNCLDD